MRCSILSTAQNMPTLEDAISLVCKELKEVDPVLPYIGNLVASYMFDVAESLRANPNGPQEELSFTNSLILNVEAEYFGECLRPRASLVESLELVGATETKEDVRVVCMSEPYNGASNVKEMPCLHRYHEDCICKWLKSVYNLPTSSVQFANIVCDQSNFVHRQNEDISYFFWIKIHIS
ncbi:hypothetical protein AMTRI_Chr04g187980 [Amborella trichopoda]